MRESDEVRRDDDAERFTLTSEGETAELDFRRRDDRIVLAHTGVPPALEGRGIGGQLVRAALAYAGDEHLTVVPTCSFAHSWIERHPEVVGDVAIDWPART